MYVRALCIRVIHMHIVRVRRTLSRDVTRVRTYVNTIHICGSFGMCACIIHVLHTTTQPDDHHTHHNHPCCHHHHKHHIISSYDDHQHFIIAELHTIINARVHIVNLVYTTLFNLYIYTRLIPQSSPNQPVMLKWCPLTHVPLAPDSDMESTAPDASSAAAMANGAAPLSATPAASRSAMKVKAAELAAEPGAMKIAMKAMKAKKLAMKVIAKRAMKAKGAMKAMKAVKAMKAMKAKHDEEAQMQKWEQAVNIAYTLTYTKQTILHRQIIYTQNISHKPHQTYHRLLCWFRNYTYHEQGFPNNV